MRVTGYDDNGRGVPVEGATVKLGPLELQTDAAGMARATLAPGPLRRGGHQGRPGALLPRAGERGVRRLAAFAHSGGSCWPAAGSAQGEEREGSAELRITRDFGRETLDSARIDSVREDDTVMRFLRREADIETSYGGRFVQEIEDLAGGGAERHPRLVLLGERPGVERRRGRVRALARRPGAVGLPRLGGDDADPGDRRAPTPSRSGAGSRASAGPSAWSARTRTRTRARPSRTGSATWAWPRPAPRWGRAERRT